jgi:hypothetical protein
MSQVTAGTADNSEYSEVGEEHGQAEQETLPDLVEPQGVNAVSGREDASSSSPDDAATEETIGASEPGDASSTVKDPSEWVTGDEAMTGAQRSYLETLAREAGEQLPANLTKAEASAHIDRLQTQTGRGA